MVDNYTPIKMVEPFTVDFTRQSVRSSLAWLGEEAVLLQLWREGDPGAQRCDLCYDDIYKSPGFMQTTQGICPECFGTTFTGGVRQAVRVWAVFSDHKASEEYGKKGTWDPDSREIQCEPFPQLTEHDIVVRVKTWTPDHHAQEVFGYYRLQEVTQDSMRTGNRFGQATWDVVGQRANLQLLGPGEPILNYPVQGVQFPDLRQIAATVIPDTYQPPVVQPDTKVVFVPVATTTPPGGPIIEPGPGAPEYYPLQTYVQEAPAATWTIHHDFPFNPGVTLVIGGQLADTDVIYQDPNTVVLVFATPQSGIAELGPPEQDFT